MPESAAEILLVMPAFNEEASVRKVVLQWFAEVDNWTDRFVFLAIDDGSTDGTLRALQGLRERLGPRLEVVTRANRGHGQTCLEGYRVAVERGIPYVFQLDSDGQCDPQFFFRFWRDRARYDVIYGHRTRRDDGFRRELASSVLRLSVWWWTGAWCVDANVPYRLMRTEAIAPQLARISPEFHLANVALAVLLRRAGARHGAFPIRFGERYGGEPKVPMSKFMTRALELRRQLRALLREA